MLQLIAQCHQKNNLTSWHLLFLPTEALFLSQKNPLSGCWQPVGWQLPGFRSVYKTSSFLVGKSTTPPWPVFLLLHFGGFWYFMCPGSLGNSWGKWTQPGGLGCVPVWRIFWLYDVYVYTLGWKHGKQSYLQNYWNCLLMFTLYSEQSIRIRKFSWKTGWINEITISPDVTWSLDFLMVRWCDG